jgi:hypothetical protein
VAAPAEVPPGWYPDQSGRSRYWNGTTWTHHVAPDASGQTTPAAASAGWYDDPTRRHARRYFDGASSTDHVVDAAGTQTVDALQGAAATSAVDPRFAEVAAKYAASRAQVDADQLPPEQLDQILSSLIFESGGRFWTIGANSGAWYVSDGQAWVRAAGRGGG